MSVLEILPPSCHKVCYFIKTKFRDQETANMAAESQSHQVIHEENEIGLVFFLFFFFLSSLYYDVLKKDFKDCFKHRFWISHEKFRG